MFDSGGIITNIFMCFKSSGIKPPLDLIMISKQGYTFLKIKSKL